MKDRTQQLRERIADIHFHLRAFGANGWNPNQSVQRVLDATLAELEAELLAKIEDTIDTWEGIFTGAVWDGIISERDELRRRAE